MAQRKDGSERPPRGAASPERLRGNPRIEITPSPAQYRRLCRDLAALRAQGATSNTAAILDAVHRAAGRAKVGGRSEKTVPKRLPRAKARR